MSFDPKLNRLDVFDTYTYVLIGPFSILASFALFLSHTLVKELRSQPGDLILMISFSEFVLSIHWV